MSEYFEYKYLVNDTFCAAMINENLACNAAVAECFFDFQSLLIGEKNARALAIYSEALVKLADYEGNVEPFIIDYKRLLKLCDSVSIDELLDENEREYFNRDMKIINEAFSEKALGYTEVRKH